jgi:hypothetical protein
MEATATGGGGEDVVVGRVVVVWWHRLRHFVILYDSLMLLILIHLSPTAHHRFSFPNETKKLPINGTTHNIFMLAP